MTLIEASKKFKIGIRDLKRMVGENFISDPLTDRDIDHLRFLCHFWGKWFWVKRQLSRRSMKERMNIIQTAGMTKIESYIYSRYMNANANGQKVRAERIAEEVQDIYGKPIDDRLMKLIYTIRKKVLNKNSYQKQKAKESIE